MIWPGEMVDAAIDLLIRVACSLCSEFEDAPFFTMLLIEEGHQLINRVSICFLGPY